NCHQADVGAPIALCATACFGCLQECRIGACPVKEHFCERTSTYFHPDFRRVCPSKMTLELNRVFTEQYTGLTVRCGHVRYRCEAVSSRAPDWQHLGTGSASACRRSPMVRIPGVGIQPARLRLSMSGAVIDPKPFGSVPWIGHV